MKFTIDPEGIALDAETIIDLQRFEVQSVGAVVLTRHGDVLAVEHARVALHAPGQRLDECVIRIARGSLRTTRKVRQPTVQRLTVFPVDWCCKIMKKSIKKGAKMV